MSTLIQLAPFRCKYGLDKITNIFKRKVYSPEAPRRARGGWCPAKLTKSPYPGTSRAED